MVKILGLDRRSFDESCNAIGTSWWRNIKPSDDDKDNIDVQLSEDVKVVSHFDTLTIMCEHLETSFDTLDFVKVEIT